MRAVRRKLGVEGSVVVVAVVAVAVPVAGGERDTSIAVVPLFGFAWFAGRSITSCTVRLCCSLSYLLLPLELRCSLLEALIWSQH